MSTQKVFRALADPTRRQILLLLREGDLAAGDVASHFSMTQPSISHHLGVLREAGLVDATRRGQQIIYSLNATVLHELLVWLLELQSGSRARRGL